MRYKGAITDTKPWYRYFWPWFILTIILWTLLSASGMLYFAYKDPYSLIEDSSKVGKIVVSESKSKKMAQSLGIEATISKQAENFKILLSPDGYANDYQNLSLLILHPSNEEKDKILKLKLIDGQLISGKFTDPVADWQVKLNNHFAGWTISGRLKLGFKNQANLK